MRRQARKILAGVLAITLLSGCGALAPAPPADVPPPEMIACIPLDDRPDNVERPEYLAASLGYTLVFPDMELFRTRLDGQGTPASGDRAALYEWLLKQEAQGCDRYLISLDQLLSGGLVSSRALSGETPVTLSDGRTLSEGALLRELIETLTADEENRVYLTDSVMRLAPTVGYGGYTLEDYNAIRAYGMAPRPEAGELTAEAVLALEGLGADGSPLDPAAFGTDGQKTAAYLACRARKLTLACEAETLLGDLDGRFRLLLGIDDSSAEDCVQKNEIALLRAGLREADVLLSGVDDLEFKALTRLYLDEKASSLGMAAAVRYFGGTEDLPACDYDFQPLKTVVREHFDYFGLKLAEGEDADFDCLILTQPSEGTDPDAVVTDLIAALTANAKAKRPTVLIDAGNGRYAPMLQQRLTREVSLGGLLAYAGFLDMAIVTGTALSHGVARFARLSCDAARSPEAENAFIKTLADSLIVDFCFKNDVRPRLLTRVRGELGGSADNFCVPQLDIDALTAWVDAEMLDASAALRKNIAGSKMLTAVAPRVRTRKVGAVGIANCRYPWQRAFEITLDISCGKH